MNPNHLLQIALTLEDEVIEVVPLGGHWEIWFQVELGRVLHRAGIGVQLEVDYGGGGGPKRMDLVLRVANRNVTVELKVESATIPDTFAGSGYYKAVGDDLFKSRAFEPSVGDLEDEDRWALAVAYSEKAVARMEELWNDTPPSYLGRGPRLASHASGWDSDVVGIAAALYVSHYY